MNLRTLPLREHHAAAGARFVSFAGWEMPVHYPWGTLAEHLATRSCCGLFDVSHMARIRVSGPDQSVARALELLTTRPLIDLPTGRLRYVVFPDHNGHPIDDALVWHHAPNAWDVVHNASTRGLFLEHLRSSLSANLGLEDLGDHHGILALQGPRAAEALASVAQGTLPKRRFSACEVIVNGVSVEVTRTGYTGEDGFELHPRVDDINAVWKALETASPAPVLCGLASRDLLRLEAALPLGGHELTPHALVTESVDPRFVDLEHQFTGVEAMRRTRDAGNARQMVGVRLLERAVPRQGAAVRDAQGFLAGEVTSGGWSPLHQAGIAMVRALPGTLYPGAPCALDVRGRDLPAVACLLPFGQPD